MVIFPFIIAVSPFSSFLKHFVVSGVPLSSISLAVDNNIASLSPKRPYPPFPVIKNRGLQPLRERPKAPDISRFYLLKQYKAVDEERHKVFRKQSGKNDQNRYNKAVKHRSYSRLLHIAQIGIKADRRTAAYTCPGRYEVRGFPIQLQQFSDNKTKSEAGRQSKQHDEKCVLPYIGDHLNIQRKSKENYSELQELFDVNLIPGR